jgi:hypothetical protein
MKNLVIIIVLALVGGGAAFGYIKWKANSASQNVEHHDGDGHDHDGHDHNDGGAAHGNEVAAVEGDVLCAKHRIPESKDGFCHPDVIATLGFCKEHDVDEAFCTRCSPILIAAFKAEGDWCAAHNLPESQCAICKGESSDDGGGAGAATGGHGVTIAEGDVMCSRHRIPQSKDGFCHPEIIAQLGFCKEHNVDEAFCTRCSPILIAAFKAEGDWCAEHNLPESQCAICKGEGGS